MYRILYGYNTNHRILLIFDDVNTLQSASLINLSSLHRTRLRVLPRYGYRYELGSLYKLAARGQRAGRYLMGM